MRGGDRWRDGLLAAGIGAALLALATLQHHWTRQASEAEEQRLRAALAERLRNFAHELDAAFTQIPLRFWIDPAWLARRSDWRTAAGAELARADLDWRTSSPAPGLVAELLVASAEEAPARLLRLDRGRRTLEPATWPADLEPVRRFLERQASGGADWRDADGPGPTALTLYGMLSSPPAVVLPLLSGTVPERKRGAPEPPLLRACLIVRLDAETLVGRWLPALAARHFPPADYDLSVRAGGERGAIVYARAAQGAEAVLQTPDGRIRLLTLELDEIGLRAHEPRSRPAHVEMAPPGNRAGFPSPSPEARPRRLLEFLREGEGPERLEWLARTAAERGWLLAVKHRAGSLAAAAERVRVHNLLLSYGLLLALAASVGLAAVSSRAARRLARRELEFVAGVSHELRTPVASIRALSTNLADGLVSSREQVAEYGRHLQKESSRLGDLVERTLEYAGIESGRRRWERRPVELAAVAREAIAACVAAGSPSRVELAAASDLPPVLGDSGALTTAVRNLVDNALRYSSGSVSVTVERHREGVAVTVSDHGPGIDPGDLGHLFDPFFRGRDAASGGARGVGIGLTLARRIALAHGGRIDVHSRPGRGSRFTLRLPAAEGP